MYIHLEIAYLSQPILLVLSPYPLDFSSSSKHLFLLPPPPIYYLRDVFSHVLGLIIVAKFVEELLD